MRLKKAKLLSGQSAVVLLSGGLDSTTCLYLAKSQMENVYALSFDYGQRHSIELKRAKKIASNLEIPHFIVKIPSELFQGSSLVDHKIQVPKLSLEKHIYQKEIPNTYVPGRNILFLSYALSFAESRNLNRIFIGVNALDYSGYPDCRPEFIQAFQTMADLGTKSGVKSRKNTSSIQIISPLIQLSKKEIVLLAAHLGVPFHQTISCYDPNPKTGKPCGKCDSCLLRKKGFEDAGLLDG
jgi:7-cyano-7-deazaguanine synthase